MAIKRPTTTKKNAKPKQSSNGTNSWRPYLSSYDDADLRVLGFKSINDAYTALDMVWKGSLRGVPFGIPGYNSLVVPKDAVKFFTEAGLPFEETKLLLHEELTSQELNELRKQSIY